MSLSDDEKTLVEGIKKKEESSYTQLVKTYWHELNYSAQRIIKSQSDANDCVQDGLIKAIERIDTFSAKGSLKS